MTRNLGSGQLRNAILRDLRSYQPLLDALDTTDLDDVNGPDNPVSQVYSQQTIQDTDYPVGIGIGLMRGGDGTSNSSSTSATFIVQATVNARLGWRQAVDQDEALGLSESYMDHLLSHVGARANIAFSVPYVQPNGSIGGSDMIEADEGAQWSLPGRWSVTRTVVGDDGPQA
ncbi:hypothetical protein C464_06205 [Halorubrum coriense DSM 10284]|uniref:Uncharacterized protein n=1 Tax=Halorubrum coriense DSM 10284 TaxID=1227466 RepID=M0EMI7_9EURY|nr:hypothetical protein [Halorubrum coriense]ELZ48981.1 hypothetical protein C464_06205 [Halorubrum coriense DSM 10284]QRG24124.1 hypothetical protein HrrHm1_065 [Halorubrum virus Humcor1]